MIACLIVRADKRALRLCRELEFETTAGKTGVVGLMGDDAAWLFPQLTEAQRAWLAAPCGSRETKVLLVAGGLALRSVEIENGRSSVRVAPC